MRKPRNGWCSRCVIINIVAGFGLPVKPCPNQASHINLWTNERQRRLQETTTILGDKHALRSLLRQWYPVS